MKIINEKNGFDVFKREFLRPFFISTIHGITNILENENIIIKLMWGLCLVSGICGTSYIIIQSIIA
jgi:hypothetical protein